MTRFEVERTGKTYGLYIDGGFESMHDTPEQAWGRAKALKEMGKA